jgi:MYXO-CTERM domain-containing protein
MGIEFDTFMPVRSLNGAFPARGSEATSAYSQSYSLVDFLLDKYGQEKMQALLLALAGASGYDQALEQVYGFNVDGLEEAWRAAIGAPPRSIPPTPTPIVAAAIPTVNPAGVAQSQPTPASNAAAPSEPDSGASSGICALGLVPLLAIAGLAGLRQSRRRSRRQSWRRS